MGYDLQSHNKEGAFEPDLSVLDGPEYSDLDFIEKAAMAFEIAYQSPDKFRFSIDVWPMVLDLAKFYGWEPEGTLAPWRYSDPESGYDPRLAENWDPSKYWANEGQTVTATDAVKLADALENALDDIPDHDDLPDKMIRIRKGDKLPEGASAFTKMIDEKILNAGGEIITANIDQGPFHFFGGAWKEKLIDFIEFCRRGAFDIH